MRWPAPGSLHGEFEVSERFLQHGWAHTNFNHKKRVGIPIAYTAPRNVTLCNGQEKKVMAGTLPSLANSG